MQIRKFNAGLILRNSAIALAILLLLEKLFSSGSVVGNIISVGVVISYFFILISLPTWIVVKYRQSRFSKSTNYAPVSNSKKMNILGSFGGWTVFFIAYGISRYSVTAGLFFLLVMIITSLTWWLSGLYQKRGHSHFILEKIIVFSSLITWFLPVIGFITSSAAIRFGTGEPKRRTWIIVGVFGLVLSLLNSGYAVFLK